MKRTGVPNEAAKLRVIGPVTRFDPGGSFGKAKATTIDIDASRDDARDDAETGGDTGASCIRIRRERRVEHRRIQLKRFRNLEDFEEVMFQGKHC